MAHMSYGRYNVIFFSKAEYDSSGVAFTNLMEDFPVVLGNPVFFDSIDMYRPHGRDPADGLPLWIDQVVTRYKMTPTTHGVQSLGSVYAPEQGGVPAVSLVEGWVTNAAVLVDIDAVGKYFVLGIYPQDIAGDDIPAALQPYSTDAPIPTARWTELRNGMVTMGMDAEKIDTWYANHPEATPLQVKKAFTGMVK